MEKASEKIFYRNSEILYPFHGGNLHVAAQQLEVPCAHVIDFSASVNPLGCSPHVRLALQEPKETGR